MNNLTQYLLGLSILVLLACCSAENALLPNNPGTKVPDETAYISLAVDIHNAPETRGYDGTFEGTLEERYVQNMRMVLYDGDTDAATVIRCLDYNIKSTDNGTNAWEGSDLAPGIDLTDKGKFTTYAREVPNMDYYTLILINPTASMKSATEAGKKLSDFQVAQKFETADKTNNIGGLATDKNFVMTNCKGLIHTPAAAYLKGTKNAAHNTPVKIAVERLVAKVTFKTENGGTTIPVKTGAEAGKLTWGLDITNRWTYPLRKGTENSSAGREDWYAEDPNYAGTGSSSESNRNGQFFYYLSKGSTPAAFPKSLNDSEYCLENTMNASEQSFNNVITRVLIRCTYKPVNVETLGKGYYVYLNETPAPVAYTLENMKQLWTIAENEAAINLSISPLSQAILNAKAAGYDFSTGSIPKHNNSNVSASFETNGIRYYHEGVNYYAIKILHFGDSDSDTPGFGHYGVLRNTHYTVILDRILGPGAINLEAADISTRSNSGINSDIYTGIETRIIR